jgi:hypothetical protein
MSFGFAHFASPDHQFKMRFGWGKLGEKGLGTLRGDGFGAKFDGLLKDAFAVCAFEPNRAAHARNWVN